MKTTIKPLMIILSILLLLAPLALAQEVDNARKIYRSEYLTLNANVGATIKVLPQGAGASVSQVGADISFFPKETSLQRIIERKYTPVPETTKNPEVMQFFWERPSMVQPLYLEMNTKLRINNNPNRIYKKVPFPLTSVPTRIQKYTQPSKIIDTNPAIIRLASELAEGEDDMVVVVDKIAAWVTQNIDYDLSTATADASQPASWVLANKLGVCDELTSLFSAMLRSLGIPVRFVAGISYTNSELFQNRWGPHGWAEVYFPEYGWIPYDVTYGEYGYVDPSHIFAKESLDAEKISSRFTWRGRNIDLDVGDFDTKVQVLEFGPEIEQQIAIEVRFEKDAVGFGSHNLVVARIRNLRDYYQSLDMRLSKTTKLDILDDLKQHILLKPKEAKTIFWRVKVKDDLEKNFIYTFPMSVYTTGNVSTKKTFKAIDGGVMLSQKRIEKVIQGLDEGTPKETVSDLMISCTPQESAIYLNEQTTLSCSLTNKGNKLLEDLKVCFEEQCITEEIGITQTKQVTFAYLGNVPRPSAQELIITATNEDIDASTSLEIKVLDKPEINIINLSAPDTVGYYDNYMITFSLTKQSTAIPKNVQVKVDVNNLEKEFSITELLSDQPFELQFSGSDLGSGENTIDIEVTYQGEKQDAFTAQAQKTIFLTNLTFWQKVKAFFGTIGNTIISWVT